MEQLMGMMSQVLQATSTGDGQRQELMESGSTGRGVAHNESGGASRAPPTADTIPGATAVGAAAAAERIFLGRRAASEPSRATRATNQWTVRSGLFQPSHSATNITSGGGNDDDDEPVNGNEISNPSYLPKMDVKISRLDAEIESVNEEIAAVEAQLRKIEAALEAGESYQGVSDPEMLFQKKMQIRRKEWQIRRKEWQVRRKKWQLRQNVWQLRQMEAQLSANTGMVKISEGLLAFAENLTSSKLENELLTLPGGVFFLGDIDRGHKIFIREEYEKLQEVILSRVNDEGIRNVVVTGTPGIGKSIFNFYLLYLLRLEGKTVICDFKEDWYRFSDKGVEAAKKMDPFVKAGYMEDRSSWFLCDPESKPSEKFKGITIVTMSVETSRTNEFMKQRGAIKLYMDIWSLEELHKCRSLVYRQRISVDYVDEAFKIAGGVARVAFDISKLKGYVSDMNEELRNIRLWNYQTAFQGLGEALVSTDKVSDKLFHLMVMENTKNRISVITFASPYALNLVFEEMGRRNVACVNSLLATCLESLQINAKAPGVIGVYFEKAAHASLRQSGANNGTKYRRFNLTGGSEVDTVSFPFRGEELFTDTKKIPRFFKSKTYYVPQASNFEGIDALGVGDDGVLYLFQMKSAGIKSPPISLKGSALDVWGNVDANGDGKLIESDGPRECIYVFVVPETKGEGVKDPSDAMFDGVIAKEEKRKNGADAWRRTPSSDFFRISEVWVIGMPIEKYLSLNDLANY